MSVRSREGRTRNVVVVAEGLVDRLPADCGFSYPVQQDQWRATAATDVVHGDLADPRPLLGEPRRNPLRGGRDGRPGSRAGCAGWSRPRSARAAPSGSGRGLSRSSTACWTWPPATSPRWRAARESSSWAWSGSTWRAAPTPRPPAPTAARWSAPTPRSAPTAGNCFIARAAVATQALKTKLLAVSGFEPGLEGYEQFDATFQLRGGWELNGHVERDFVKAAEAVGEGRQATHSARARSSTTTPR